MLVYVKTRLVIYVSVCQNYFVVSAASCCMFFFFFLYFLLLLISIIFTSLLNSFIAVGFNNIYFIIYIHSGIAKNQATFFHRLRFLILPSNQSLSRLCLSPLSPSHCHSSAQISSSILTLSSLPLSLVAIALSQLSPDLFLTLSKSQSLSRLYLSPSSSSQLSLDRSSLSHAHLCLSPSSPSQLTLCLVAVAIVWYFDLFFLC